MPVNDFEKQVQQKMDELQLRPSAEVWEEVEKRIRKEKKRRWFILWFFIFGVLLLGGTGWWLTAGNKDHVADNNVTTQRITKKTADETAGTQKKVTFEKANENNNKEKSEIVEDAVPTKRETTTKTAIIPDKSELVPVQIRKQTRNEKQIESPVTVSLKSKKVRKDGNLLPDVSKENQVVVLKNNPTADNLIKTNNAAADINTTIKDAVAGSESIAVKNDPVVSAKDTIVAMTVKDSLAVAQAEVISKKDTDKTKKNKWEIGINVMAGTSNKTDGISIFGMERSLDAAGINYSAGSGGQSVITQPAGPGNGFSWQTGVYAKRKLTVRTDLSIGLAFSSYSTTQLTGTFVDSSRLYSNNLYSSSVRNFYRTGTGVTYKNHYYYLQLPVSFHWQINKGKKLPIVFQNGFSIGVFTGSDALVYNSGSNVFYRDNKSFNKTQVSYQSGLYAKFFNRSKNPLMAGILFNYHLSKLQKVNINGGNHLSSFGIQIGWLLKK